MRLKILGVLLVLGLGAAAGCGGDDGGDDGGTQATQPSVAPSVTTSPDPSEADLEDPAAGAAAVAATRQYLDAFINGRAAQVCALQTPRFAQRQIDNAVTFKLVKKGATCVDFVKAVLKTSDQANPDPAADPVYQVVALSAGAAVATVRVDYPQSIGTNPDTYALIKRDGGWLIDEDKDVPAQ